MNALQLRETVESKLSSLIGTYTVGNNNQTIPAIWVGHMREKLETKGLEVLLPVAPIMTKRRNIKRRRWIFHLVQHESSISHIEEALTRLEGIAQVSEIKFQPISQNLSKSPDFLYNDFAVITWLDWEGT